MDAMVGKQVRVSGIIAKRADLPAFSVTTPNSPDDAKNSSMERSTRAISRRSMRRRSQWYQAAAEGTRRRVPNKSEEKRE